MSINLAPLQYGLPMNNQLVYSDPINYLNETYQSIKDQNDYIKNQYNGYNNTPHFMNVPPIGLPTGVSSLGTAAMSEPMPGLYQKYPPLANQPIGQFMPNQMFNQPASIVNMTHMGPMGPMYPAPMNMQPVIPGMPLPISDVPYPIPFPDNVIQPLDVHEEDDAKDKTIDYFYKKCHHEWIYTFFRDAYKYLKVVGDKVKYITSLTEYRNRSKDSDHDIELKGEFVKSKYLTYDFIKRYIMVYAVNTGFKWFELKRNESNIAEMFVSKLKNAIKGDISKLTKKD
jgi:hypothetical protein